MVSSASARLRSMASSLFSRGSKEKLGSIVELDTWESWLERVNQGYVQVATHIHRPALEKSLKHHFERTGVVSRVKFEGICSAVGLGVARNHVDDLFRIIKQPSAVLGSEIATMMGAELPTDLLDSGPQEKRGVAGSWGEKTLEARQRTVEAHQESAVETDGPDNRKKAIWAQSGRQDAADQDTRAKDVPIGHAEANVHDEAVEETPEVVNTVLAVKNGQSIIAMEKTRLRSAFGLISGVFKRMRASTESLGSHAKEGGKRVSFADMEPNADGKPHVDDETTVETSAIVHFSQDGAPPSQAPVDVADEASANMLSSQGVVAISDVESLDDEDSIADAHPRQDMVASARVESLEDDSIASVESLEDEKSIANAASCQHVVAIANMESHEDDESIISMEPRGNVEAIAHVESLDEDSIASVESRVDVEPRQDEETVASVEPSGDNNSIASVEPPQHDASLSALRAHEDVIPTSNVEAITDLITSVQCAPKGVGAPVVIERNIEHSGRRRRKQPDKSAPPEDTIENRGRIIIYLKPTHLLPDGDLEISGGGLFVLHDEWQDEIDMRQEPKPCRLEFDRNVAHMEPHIPQKEDNFTAPKVLVYSCAQSLLADIALDTNDHDFGCVTEVVEHSKAWNGGIRPPWRLHMVNGYPLTFLVCKYVALTKNSEEPLLPNLGAAGDTPLLSAVLEWMQGELRVEFALDRGRKIYAQ